MERPLADPRRQRQPEELQAPSRPELDPEQAARALLPADFVARLPAIVGAAQVGPVLASFARPRPVCLRVNTLRLEVAEAERRLRDDGLHCQPVAWAPALLVPHAQRQTVLAHPLLAAGRLAPQGLASIAAVVALAPRPGEELLDLCAAPGGKTLLACQLMGDRGRLAAVEAVRPRFFKLKALVAAAGASCVRLYQADGRGLYRKVPGRFDRVLADVPCSSEARFSLDEPERWRYWSLRKLDEMARKQRALLRSAVQCLRPGGRLLYVTCTFAPEENELVLDGLLADPPVPVALEELALPLPSQPGLTSWHDRDLRSDLALARRILPGPTHGGLFCAALRRLG